MPQAIVGLVSCQAMRNQAATLEQRLVELQQWMLTDAACQGCELLRQGEVWQLRGLWLSRQALEANLRLPHLQEMLGRLLGEGLAQCLEMGEEASGLSHSSGG